DTKSLSPNPALIPYEVNVPLWSDRAKKQRWIGLSSAEKIDGDPAGHWNFPVGTVLVKQFDLPLDERDNDAGPIRRLETRVLVRDKQGGVYGATYRWNDDQTDADLLTSAQTEEIEYVDKQGTSQKQTWFYPGQIDCKACHNDVAGGVLGFSARQLNRDTIVGGMVENQLVRFSRAGMVTFDCPQSKVNALPKLTEFSDTSASVEDRMRSYLDANCSHCHQRRNHYGAWDARIEIPLSWQGIIEGIAVTHRGRNPDARVVKPRDL